MYLFTMHKAITIEELETVYSKLHNENPSVEIDVVYDANVKEYTVTPTTRPYTGDPQVPMNLEMKVIYGDSVAKYTPILLREKSTGVVHFKAIEDIVCGDYTLLLGKEEAVVEGLQVYSNKGWNDIQKVIRHRTNKRMYRVHSMHGTVDVTEDHSLLDTEGNPLKPYDCTRYTRLMHAYPSEFTDSFTRQDVIDYYSTRLSSTPSDVEIARMYYYHKKFPCLEGNWANKKFRLDDVYNHHIKLDISELGSSGSYVYDIQTELGCFQAGIGELIVKNTDSIFVQVKFNRSDHELNRRDSFKLSTICSDNLTRKVFNREPIEMEFEKVFQPFVLITKKRYVGKKYDDLKDPMRLKEITSAGIAITRRDYCELIKVCFKKMIDEIVNNQDIDAAERVYMNTLDDIEQYNVDVNQLVVTCQLNREYKTEPVHVVLAKKLKSRNCQVQIGDRIPYIFIEGEKGVKKSLLGEDPEYAREHGLKFNRSCYIEQLSKPILGFLKVVMKDDPSRTERLVKFTQTRLTAVNGPKLKASDFVF